MWEAQRRLPTLWSTRKRGIEMGKWTEQVELPPIKFDGDDVVFSVSRLTVADMAEVMQYFDAATQKLSLKQEELCALAAKLVPKYVNNLVGMTKADGTAWTREEFIKVASQEFYFVSLVGELLGSLVSVSVVGSAEKNSEPPSAAQ